MWLGDGSTSASPEAITAEIAKLGYLRDLGADRLDLSAIPPERVRQLATLARRSTPKALRLTTPERRYPILLAALASAHAEIVDELVRMFDLALAGTDKRARDIVRERQLAVAEANGERLVLLDEILDVVLDDDLDDGTVGTRLRGLGHARLATAARSADERLPADGGRLQLVEARFSHVRSFAPPRPGCPHVCGQRDPQRSPRRRTPAADHEHDGKRHVPTGAPTGFVPARWQPCLTQAIAAGRDNEFKHYWDCACCSPSKVRSSSPCSSRRTGPPLAAEVIDPEVLAQNNQVLARLPMVPLAEILIDVDRDTGLSSQLTHAGGATPRTSELEHRRNLGCR